MTRRWIASVSRTLKMDRPGSARARRHGAAPCLEDLEYRLSLSSYSAGGFVGPDLNPQPLPPRPPVIPFLNPQPLPPRAPIMY